jgi:hypothetical protein
MRTQTIPAICLSLILAACQAPVSSPTRDESQPMDAAVVQLITTPERFEGKRIRVAGYLHLEFEGNGLYAHQEDFEHSLYKNGLWINIDRCGDAGRPSINDVYVLVEGQFTDQDQGHMGLWSGSLSEITRCVILPGRSGERASNNSFKPSPQQGGA